jgi:Eco57I restriction-modification methylase
MNTAVLKTFAPLVRRQLMEAVTQKLDFVLSAKTPDILTTFAGQVAALRKLAQADRSGLIERVAYTWFNRLAALRYLDARGWHPFRTRVLTAASPDETQPELLKLMRAEGLPEELRSHTNASRLNNLLDGRIPSPDPQGEVYRHLVLAACHFYHALLPDLFERLDDETELLLPDDLLTEQSVVQGFRTEITDADCAEVEVLGWLYQFYISEKKDAVMGRKVAVPTEDIPAVTQLFTPHWIVRYLVENSLGRLWLLNRPGSRLRERMPYYIESDSETDFLRISKPEEIRLLDPAVGSGHMLTYAFDLLCAIYEEEGYAPSDIPGLILVHNLFGVDICPRAAQLASLALVLKAREKLRRFFQPGTLVRPGILCMEDVRFSEDELREYVEALDLGDLFTRPVMDQLHQFENATTLGSLIQPCLDENGIAFVRAAIEAKDIGARLFLHETHVKVLRVVAQAEVLARHYHVVVANPPYMGSGAMNEGLKDFISERWAAGKADTYAAFMIRNLEMVLTNGSVAMITIPNWMFLTSFATLREAVLNAGHVSSMVHCGRGVWGSDFGSCAFVLCANPRSDRLSRLGRYRRLFRRQGEVQTNEEIEANFFDPVNFPYYSATTSDFRSIPGSPIAYWASPGVRASFARGISFADYFFSDGLTKTGDNERFLRKIWEVDRSSVEDPDNYRICVKGGEQRKFYGNLDNIVRWTPAAKQHYKTDFVARITPEYLWQSEGISWTKVSSAGPTFRRFYAGMIAETGGPAIFAKEAAVPFINGALGFLCSKVCSNIATILNPTLNAQTNDILRLPLDVEAAKAACAFADEAVSLSKADWDNSETSWNFLDLPILRPELKAATLETSWQNLKVYYTAAICRMQRLETEVNRLFIDAYGLQDELRPNVPEDEITLARPNARRDMAAFLSYAVGCTMGRYSLDKPGLVLANARDTLEQYSAIVGEAKDQFSFAPCEDGIIPVLDDAWFEDDIVARTREFLRVTFGETTLRENVRFIEESLGKDLRKYFLTDFYRDHLQTYKKRPIYWLVQSPRKGFTVLIYLHRYTRDTMNLVLNRYLRDHQAKLRNRAAHLAHVLASDGSSTREKTEARKEADKIAKTLHECEEWERQTVLPLAQARIELNLDDGVKVNYLKLGEALAPVAGLESKEEE